MRRPPPYAQFPKFPVVSGTIVLAIAVSLASWSGKLDVSALYESAEIRRGELWRLLTSTLPHGSFLHLIFNVYWIWVFGTLFEQIFGHLKTVALFVLLAVAANGAEYAFLEGGIGLSGVGYGLFGCLWVLSKRDRRFEEAIDRNTINLFVAWFFICIAMTYAGYPIANLAHGVGAIAGALVGWTIVSSSKERFAATASVTGLVVGVLIAATVVRPWINFSKNGGVGEGRLGYDDLMANRNADAVKWLRDAIRIEPRTASYWYNLGIAYRRLDQHGEAVAAFKRAHAPAPGNEEYSLAWKSIGEEN